MGKRHDEFEAHVLYAWLAAQAFADLLVPPHERVAFELLLVHAKGNIHQSRGIEAHT